MAWRGWRLALGPCSMVLEGGCVFWARYGQAARWGGSLGGDGQGPGVLMTQVAYRHCLMEEDSALMYAIFPG